MAIVESWDYTPLDEFDDPDDYRPNSELALVIDPAEPTGQFVEELTVFKERIAPGDRVPLHQHTLAEVFFLDEGHLEVTLGEERREISRGAIVFVPSRVQHGFRNVGETVAHVHAVFPSRTVDIRYLERNPAPGTEGEDAGPPMELDVREVLEGNPEKGIRVISAEAFTS